jgi:hypothetical protein
VYPGPAKNLSGHWYIDLWSLRRCASENGDDAPDDPENRASFACIGLIEPGRAPHDIEIAVQCFIDAFIELGISK